MLNGLKNDRKKSRRPIGQHETFGAYRDEGVDIVPAILGSAMVMVQKPGSDRTSIARMW